MRTRCRGAANETRMGPRSSGCKREQGAEKNESPGVQVVLTKLIQGVLHRATPLVLLPRERELKLPTLRFARDAPRARSFPFRDAERSCRKLSARLCRTCRAN